MDPFVAMIVVIVRAAEEKCVSSVGEEGRLVRRAVWDIAARNEALPENAMKYGA